MLAIPVVDGDESAPDCMAVKPDYVYSPHASHRSQREEVFLEITAAILKTTATVVPIVPSMKVKYLFILVTGKVDLVSLLNFAI